MQCDHGSVDFNRSFFKVNSPFFTALPSIADLIVFREYYKIYLQSAASVSSLSTVIVFRAIIAILSVVNLVLHFMKGFTQDSQDKFTPNGDFVDCAI